MPTPRDRVLKRIGKDALEKIEAKHAKSKASDNADYSDVRKTEAGKYGENREMLKGVGASRDAEITKKLKEAGGY